MLSSSTFLDSIQNRCGWSPGEPVLAGLSGGLDSVVLCELLRLNEIPFAVAHVNYGLRGKESDEDEKFAAALAEKANVPFYLQKCDEASFAASDENSTQAAARKIRYAFFEEIAVTQGFQHIAVAHHFDDSIETALLNLARGTGIAGLTGIDFRNGKIIRPLLKFQRAEILSFAGKSNLYWREDSSNASDAYSRNRFRHHLLPWLLDEIPQSHEGFAASFAKLSETEKLIGSALDYWENKCCIFTQQENTVQILRKEWNGFPNPELFLRFYLKQFGFTDAQLFSLEKMIEGKSGSELLSASHRLIVDREDIFLISLRGKNEKLPSLHAEPEIFTGTFPDGKNAAIIDAAGINSPLVIRTWRAGDKMIPFGMSGHRNISDILNEMKLPLHEKEKAVVIVSGEEIVWVPGYRIAEKFRVTAKTEKVLRLQLKY